MSARLPAFAALQSFGKQLIIQLNKQNQKKCSQCRTFVLVRGAELQQCVAWQRFQAPRLEAPKTLEIETAKASRMVGNVTATDREFSTLSLKIQ